MNNKKIKMTIISMITGSLILTNGLVASATTEEDKTQINNIDTQIVTLNNEIVDINNNLSNLNEKIKENVSEIQKYTDIVSANTLKNYKNTEDLLATKKNIAPYISNVKEFDMAKLVNNTTDEKVKKLKVEGKALDSELINMKNQRDSLVASVQNLEQQKNQIQIKIENERIKSRQEINYDPSNVSLPSNVNEGTLRKMLSGTALESLAPAYVQAEKEYGVNALFLVGISAIESGWGTSKRAINDNNLTGFGVYSDSSKGINSTSKEANLLLTAATLKKNYLTPGGSYFKGYSIQDVNKSYCVLSSWSGQINNAINQILNKI